MILPTITYGSNKSLLTRMLTSPSGTDDPIFTKTYKDYNNWLMHFIS